MLINSLLDTDGSRCTLAFEEQDQWLRATWRGFIDPEEALRGAQSYLAQLAGIRCPYLLNDNTGLHGPWFDSLDWLMRVWAPRAAQMGLRYVAHVVQSDTRHDTVTGSLHPPATCVFELQFFEQVADAEEWLRSCRAKLAAGPAAPPPGEGASPAAAASGAPSPAFAPAGHPD